MNVLEFTAKIEQGSIRLPQQFQAYENAYVRIMLEVETPQISKQGLLAAFKNLQKTNVFSSIENPIVWQKKLRDEWE